MIKPHKVTRRKVDHKRRRRVRIGPPSKIDNKSPKDWDLGYELVVSFQYGLDEEAISKIAGLRNYDTGIMLKTGVRDMMFPCGTDRILAHAAANKLHGADLFGALKIRISYPVEKVDGDSFTPWYAPDGKLIERVKHRKLAVSDFISLKKRAKQIAANRKRRIARKSQE
jgi:hypothetical protein